MFGFKFTIESLYFASFRKVNTTSFLSSYYIPPFTTIRGLLSNALGLARDDFLIQDWIKIGIKTNSFQKSSELSKFLKLKEGKRENNRFNSSPIFRDFLINPIYDIYVAGDNDKINILNDALKNPQRNLYIGYSDDMVDITVFDPIEIYEEDNVPISILDGIYENCIIEKVPYKFYKKGNRFELEQKIISIPKKSFNTKVNSFNFDDEFIVLM